MLHSPPRVLAFEARSVLEALPATTPRRVIARAGQFPAERRTLVADLVGREVLEFLDRLALGWAHL